MLRQSAPQDRLLNAPGETRIDGTVLLALHSLCYRHFRAFCVREGLQDWWHDASTTHAPALEPSSASNAIHAPKSAVQIAGRCPHFETLSLR